MTESGSSCSFVNCCTAPTETREQVIAYWNGYNTEKGRKWLEEMRANGWNCWGVIPEALAEGKEVFDQDGQPLYEFCNEYERKARFPDRWETEMAR